MSVNQLGQPVAPSILFPVFKSEGEPGTHMNVLFPLIAVAHPPKI